jgi:hypothetical protein
MRDLPRRAAPAGHEHVAVAQQAADRGVQRLRLGDEHRLDAAAGAHRAADRPAVGAADRLLAGGIDLGHEQHVDRRQHLGEVVQQVAGARVAVRLEREHDAPPRPALADRLERRGDLGRVMTVVVDQRDAADRQHELGEHLQAAIDALEAGERLLDRRVRDLELGRHGDRRQRIEHVVTAGNVEGDGERRGAVGTRDAE